MYQTKKDERVFFFYFFNLFFAYLLSHISCTFLNNIFFELEKVFYLCLDAMPKHTYQLIKVETPQNSLK